MNTREYSAALARIDKYAEQIKTGDAQREAVALDRAADLQQVFDSTRWVDDLDTYGLRPTANVGVTAEKAEANARTAKTFTRWINARDGLSASYAEKLLQAARWQQNWAAHTSVPGIAFRAIEPMYALERRGYGDRTPEVLARAQELAEGKRIEARHTKQALTEFWASLTKPQQRQLTRKQRTESHAAKLRTEVRWFIDNGQRGTLGRLLKWATEQVLASQREATGSTDGKVVNMTRSS
jgi:hypothetical protein